MARNALSVCYHRMQLNSALVRVRRTIWNMRTRTSIAGHGSHVPQHHARSFDIEILFSGDLHLDTFAQTTKDRVVRLNSAFAELSRGG